MSSESGKGSRRASSKPIVLAFLGAVLSGYLVFSLLFAPGTQHGDTVRRSAAGAPTCRHQRRRHLRGRPPPPLPLLLPPRLALAAAYSTQRASLIGFLQIVTLRQTSQSSRH